MFEHQLVIIEQNPSPDSLQDEMDQYAADGWVLVAHAIRRSTHYLTFGRELEERQ